MAKTITIKGSFTVKSVNQTATVEVFTIDSNGFKNDYPGYPIKFTDDFNLILDQCTPNQNYYVDFVGYTFGGTFTFNIIGDIANPTPPISDTFNNIRFIPAYCLLTNS